MKNKYSIFTVIVLMLVTVGGTCYYLSDRRGENTSGTNYESLKYKVSVGEYGTIKSPSETFFREVFEEKLTEEELRKLRGEYLQFNLSISEKVEEEISKENPDLHERIISYKVGRKLNNLLKEKSSYWLSRGLFALNLWKQKHEVLGKQKCSVASSIFGSDHVLMSMGKAKNDSEALKIRNFIKKNYEELLQSCVERKSSDFYSSMVMDNPKKSTLPDHILKEISRKVVSLATKDLESAKELRSKMKRGEFEGENYDLSLANMRVERLEELIEKFSKFQ